MKPAQLSVEFAGMSVSGDLLEVGRIDVTTLLSEITEHSATYGYIMTMHAACLEALGNKKRDREKLFIKLRRDLLTKAAEETDDKGKSKVPSEASMERDIAEDREYSKIEDEITKLEGIEGRLDRLCKAFASRKDLICAAADGLYRAGEDLTGKVKVSDQATKAVQEARASDKPAAGVSTRKRASGN